MHLLLVTDNLPLVGEICRALQQDGYVIDRTKNSSEKDSWLLGQTIDLGLPDAGVVDVQCCLRLSVPMLPALGG